MRVCASVCVCERGNVIAWAYLRLLMCLCACTIPTCAMYTACMSVPRKHQVSINHACSQRTLCACTAHAPMQVEGAASDSAGKPTPSRPVDTSDNRQKRGKKKKRNKAQQAMAQQADSADEVRASGASPYKTRARAHTSVASGTSISIPGAYSFR